MNLYNQFNTVDNVFKIIKNGLSSNSNPTIPMVHRQQSDNSSMTLSSSDSNSSSAPRLKTSRVFLLVWDWCTVSTSVHISSKAKEAEHSILGILFCVARVVRVDLKLGTNLRKNWILPNRKSPSAVKRPSASSISTACTAQEQTWEYLASGFDFLSLIR